MKNFAIIALVLTFGFVGAQKSAGIIASVTKNSIRKINLSLNSVQAKKVQNAAYKSTGKEKKNTQEVKIASTEIAIINNTGTPVKFAVGSNDIMNLESVNANSVWKKEVIDTW